MNTLERNHFLVKFVDLHFLKAPPLKNTCKRTVKRNHFLVKSVDLHFLQDAILKATEVTLAREKKHMIPHTGQKPFFCDVCESIVFNRYCFKIHMQTHIGEKPYC